MYIEAVWWGKQVINKEQNIFKVSEFVVLSR